MVEYLVEAKKFIAHARRARTEEVRDQDLDMADWLIASAIDESEATPDARKPARGKPN